MATFGFHNEESAPTVSSLGRSEFSLDCSSLDEASLLFNPFSEIEFVCSSSEEASLLLAPSSELVFACSSLEEDSLLLTPSSSNSSSEEERSTRVGDGHRLGSRDFEQVVGELEEVVGVGRSRGGGEGGHWRLGISGGGNKQWP